MESSGSVRDRAVPAGLPETRLPQHNLTRYIRVRLEVSDGVLRWQLPRTLLGVVMSALLRFAREASRPRQHPGL